MATATCSDQALDVELRPADPAALFWACPVGGCRDHGPCDVVTWPPARVSLLGRQNVSPVQRAGLDLDQGLSRTGMRRVHVSDAQPPGGLRVYDDGTHGTHVLSLAKPIRLRRPS